MLKRLTMENLESLAVQIQEVHQYFKNQAIKQVNNALAIRNWMVGYYIVIYEQEGNDRAAYGENLVFYHRILKCHILIDLKLGEFDHGDAGQMNVYLNYFKENEMTEYDNPPVGIILCKQKDNALVHFATGGLPMEVFVSKYKLQLPTEKELRELMESEMQYFTQK